VIATTRIFGDHTVFALEAYEIVFFCLLLDRPDRGKLERERGRVDLRRQPSRLERQAMTTPSAQDSHVVVPILPKERDPRLITIRRGGTLTNEDHLLLAEWAIVCAEHVPHLFTVRAGRQPTSRCHRHWSRLDPRRGTHGRGQASNVRRECGRTWTC